MIKAIELALKVKERGGRAFYVGGYVRDFLMHRENKDVDIEVFGLDEDILVDILKSLGEVNFFGKSFGIYSLKGENMEIALPRTEKVNGFGHKDFLISIDKNLSYEKASSRRDFTINAMMMDILSGEILDFFNGREDLKNRIIRHVDEEKFKEDPLRVFRACQFASRFDFTVDETTIDLCKNIDISFLPKERIEEEAKKALLKSKRASSFFEYLKKMNVTLYFNDLNCFNHLDKYGNNNATTNPYYFKMALIAVDNKNYLNSIKQFTNNKELLTYVNKMVDLYKSLFKDKNDFIMKMLSFPHFEELGFFLDEDERIFYNQCLKRYSEIRDELIDGTKLISWGFKADKNFGKILEYVKKRQIEGLKIEDIRAEIMKIFTKN